MLAEIQKRIYQYELTTGLYMLEPLEKTIFNTILIVFLGLFTSALVKYIFP